MTEKHSPPPVEQAQGVGAVRELIELFKFSLKTSERDGLGFVYVPFETPNARILLDRIEQQAALSAPVAPVAYQFTCDTIMRRVDTEWPDFMALQRLFNAGEIMYAHPSQSQGADK